LKKSKGRMQSDVRNRNGATISTAAAEKAYVTTIEREFILKC
jgi:hypothetical protein